MYHQLLTFFLKLDFLLMIFFFELNTIFLHSFLFKCLRIFLATFVSSNIQTEYSFESKREIIRLAFSSFFYSLFLSRTDVS